MKKYNEIKHEFDSICLTGSLEASNNFIETVTKPTGFLFIFAAKDFGSKALK